MILFLGVHDNEAIVYVYYNHQIILMILEFMIFLIVITNGRRGAKEEGVRGASL